MVEFDSMEAIVRFALAREEASIQFYRDMVTVMEKYPTGVIFESLAHEEEKHKARLELELVKLGIIVRPIILPDDTVTDYRLDENFDRKVTITDALLIAIKKETDSFRLYFELARAVSNPQSVETFMALAEEEIRHKIKFETEYKAITQEKQ